MVGVGGGVVVCAVGVDAGEGVSGKWVITKMNGHMAYAYVWTNEKSETTFTHMGPRSGLSETVAAGGNAGGAVSGFGGNRGSKWFSMIARDINISLHVCVKCLRKTLRTETAGLKICAQNKIVTRGNIEVLSQITWWVTERYVGSGVCHLCCCAMVPRVMKPGAGVR